MSKIGAPLWKIKKVISKDDYNYCLIGEKHPSCKSTNYVLEHRIIMENYLGRILNSNEVVHHIDHIKKHNDISNLQVMTRKEHSRLHGKTGRKWVKLKCPECKKLFHREERQSFISKHTEYTCCSKQCRGKFSRNIQLHGRTEGTKKAISGNLVLKYIKF